MQIGEASELTGVSAKMIRHYEGIGLIPEADRRSSNYRDYGAEDVHRLGFIRRARDLGFSIDEIRDLLKLWADKQRSSRDVKALTVAHLKELDGKFKAADKGATAATTKRDEAGEAMRKWVRKFRKQAKSDLRRHPELLAKLGM